MELELPPYKDRNHVSVVLAAPVFAALGLLLVSIENYTTAPFMVPVSIVLCIGVAVLAVKLLKRTRPLKVVLDGPPPNMQGERGYVQFSGRNTGGARYPALAFHYEGQRLVVMSKEASTSVTQRKLTGRLFILPPDEYKKLAQELRLA